VIIREIFRFIKQNTPIAKELELAFVQPKIISLKELYKILKMLRVEKYVVVRREKTKGVKGAVTRYLGG